MKEKQRAQFSGRLGFILATAGSAVGLGNLWRFPYLAAKGGGLFLFLYVSLSLTFGFVLMSTEIAIGRSTGLGPIRAYGQLNKRFSFLGWLSTAVPLPIFAYYCVIGGWVVRYVFGYLFGESATLATTSKSFLDSFLASPASLILCFSIFMLLSMIIVLVGVEKGIEKTSRIAMPLLIILILFISVYSLTLSHREPDGTLRTSWEGLRLYIIPDWKSLTPHKLLSVLVDASGQLFYSLGIAMGVMIVFGSYTKKENDLPASINWIECFDTGVAFLAGLAIIPSVFVFQGMEGLQNSGPELLFVSLPAVFGEMGAWGAFIGALFFILVLFAALTSSVSLLETVTASLCDRFPLSGRTSVLICTGITLLLGVAVCLSYNLFPVTFTMPNGSVGKLPELLEYLCNQLLLPVVALFTCILVGWILRPRVIIEELKSGRIRKSFWRERIFGLMLRYVCPTLLAVILLDTLGVI